MASSPADPGERIAAAGTVAFALRELAACWDQAYDALCRGDLERVGALLDVAHEHVVTAGDGTHDGAGEARSRRDALAARGRLEHGMRAGITAVADELARCRAGGKVLRGYASPGHGVGDHVTREA